MLTKKKKPVNPESKQLLHELEDIVQRLGYTMRYEKGNFEGGYCLVKESKLFVINSRYEAEKRISIISRNLKELGIDSIFVKPGIREIIENETAKSGEKSTGSSSPDIVSET
jgi:hypothetical protein